MQRLDKGSFCRPRRLGRDSPFESVVSCIRPEKELERESAAAVSFSQKRAAEMGKCRTATAVALRYGMVRHIYS
jgi:hypothetical protein